MLVGLRNDVIVGSVKSQLGMYFLNVYISYNYQRQNFVDYFKASAPSRCVRGFYVSQRSR